MGELSPRRFRAWAGLPFAVALALAAGTLNASLAPAPGAEELRFEHAPTVPNAPSGPAHHDAPLDDSDEPVSV